jgi:hypothetical protein
MINDKKNDKGFYKEFTSTQIFQMYIQSSLFKDNYKKTYFEEYLDTIASSKTKGTNITYEKLYEQFVDEYKTFFDIHKYYVIKPFFIKEYENFEEKYISKKKTVRLSNVSLFLSKQYENQNESNINSHGVLKENKRIISNPIELDNDNDPNEYDIYLAPGQKLEDLINKDEQNNNNSNKRDPTYRRTTSIKIISNNEQDNNQVQIRQFVGNKENELTEDEKDEIKDNIREIMARVYRSEVSKIEEDKKNIMIWIRKQFGREYFIGILNTGNIQSRDVKVVNQESYDFFSFVLFNTVLDILNLEENDKNLKGAIRLIKASLCIKTIKNKKEILLSEDLFAKLEKYSLFDKELFWRKWVEDELTKSDIKIFNMVTKSKKEYCYIDEDSEEYQLYLVHSCDALKDLTSLMKKMEIKNSFIYSTISDLSLIFIFNEEDFKNLMHYVVEEIRLFHEDNLKKHK